MSLSRYINEDQIVRSNDPQYGQIFTNEDLKILPYHQLVPTAPVDSVISQVHIYSFHGDYLVGDHNAAHLDYENITKSYLFDVAASFREANIYRGSYKIAVNLFKPVWGSPDASSVVLSEISPDRTEIKLRIPPPLVGSPSYISFRQKIESYTSDNILNNLIVDFGFNRIAKCTILKFKPSEPDIVYIKLYGRLDELINEKDSGWFAFEIADPYLDTVTLAAPISVGAANVLRRPNFDIDTSQWSSNSTVFKSWNDLLDTDAPTAQRIIDASISGSSQSIPLNIDYTSFGNFIFYSSAEERLKNFKYKVGLLEDYSSSIARLQNTTASTTFYISSSVAIQQKRVDNLISSLDHFEKWLYYAPTASIFSHDITGSLTPYPKKLVNGKYSLYHSTSSIVTSWYNSNIFSASAYDKTNYNRLWWSIPEHILMDDGNSNYVTFVEMVGNHFDNLYSYVNALTKIHERDEHHERGASNNLLWHIAKSFGWNLQNTHQLADLWHYKLGTDETGQLSSTGSMFSVPRETQTQIIWRRIVNNLPFLLKTKGTARGVKALMSIYGIPQTLISIKEYGGPATENYKPTLIEDRFAYALSLKGRQNVQLYRYRINSPSGSWQNGITKYVPDTVMFRFGTTYSGSTSMSLWSIENVDNGKRNVAELRLHHCKELVGTSSYSGSRAYGRVSFTIETSNPTFKYYSGSTDYLPLYDGDMWTVRLHTQTPVTPTSNTASFYLDVAKAADCTFGDYIISSSTTVVAYSNSGSNNFYAWGVSATQSTQPELIKLGGTTASFGIAAAIGTASFFSGSMQGYKEYFSTMSMQTFREHVLNPAAYHLDYPTESYNSLYRYFPLGLDVIRYDHSTTQSIMSSQPNRSNNFYLSASFIGFSGSQTNHYSHVNETYYVYAPSLGGTNVRNNKIRLESSYLQNDLSPLVRSEKSLYDKAPVDTGRLAIVFSLSDQVNRDIYNQFGFGELDDYIADPAIEFEDTYQSLRGFSDEYWKKYQTSIDANAFIRILSVYDYTFFEQIKQLAPGRADLIAGILIEPDLLQRSKVRITKRPTIEEPFYDKAITRPDNQVGDAPFYETSASVDIDIDFENCYYTASIDYNREVEWENEYYTASIDFPYDISGSLCHHFEIADQNTGFCGTIDVIRNRYSGSCGETGSFVCEPYIRSNCRYFRVIYHYSASGNFPNRYLKQWYTAVSMSYKMYYSRSLTPTNYQIDECSTQNNSRYRGSKLSGADFNVDSPDTIDGGPVISIFEVNPNILYTGKGTENGNISVE